MPSTLVTRNVIVSGHRTSMRLEPVMWDALAEICRRERQTVHGICSYIDQERTESSLTSAMRAFIVRYFRDAAMVYVPVGRVAVPLGGVRPGLRERAGPL